ncbi:nucleotide exchange factor GrpE [Thermopolyspora sp. NPDC052614]|uniref:nucleotide exchange factor GrpE n=1 Tax=Thermopolyspora sp. NPDC052614 TaxID=3155682 RepID=UPI0034206EBD
MTPPSTGPPQDASPPTGPESTDAEQGRPAEPGRQTPLGEPLAADAAPGVEQSALAAELDAKIAELEDRWLRAVADLDNLRKRTVRDIERSRAEERARVAREFLPVLDNLDLALQHADADPASLAEGVRAIREQAIGVLARLGYRRLDEAGVPFDPARHEAVGTAADPDAKPGTIAKVLRPGYGDGGQQLRPAMVVVVATDARRDGP